MEGGSDWGLWMIQKQNSGYKWNLRLNIICFVFHGFVNLVEKYSAIDFHEDVSTE